DADLAGGRPAGGGGGVRRPVRIRRLRRSGRDGPGVDRAPRRLAARPRAADTAAVLGHPPRPGCGARGPAGPGHPGGDPAGTWAGRWWVAAALLGGVAGGSVAVLSAVVIPDASPGYAIAYAAGIPFAIALDIGRSADVASGTARAAFLDAGAWLAVQALLM